EMFPSPRARRVCFRLRRDGWIPAKSPKRRPSQPSSDIHLGRRMPFVAARLPSRGRPNPERRSGRRTARAPSGAVPKLLPKLSNESCQSPIQLRVLLKHIARGLAELHVGSIQELLNAAAQELFGRNTGLLRPD